jgi:hypothetical protein
MHACPALRYVIECAGNRWQLGAAVDPSGHRKVPPVVPALIAIGVGLGKASHAADEYLTFVKTV